MVKYIVLYSILALLAALVVVIVLRSRRDERLPGGGSDFTDLSPGPDAKAEDSIRGIIAEHMGIEVDCVQNSMTLGDLDIDKLDVVEILAEVEDEFMLPGDIPDARMGKKTTVAGLIRLCLHHIQESQRSVA